MRKKKLVPWQLKTKSCFTCGSFLDTKNGSIKCPYDCKVIFPSKKWQT